ncbi:MAG: alpha/beta fold hydrolase [Paracoccaceae bacterium]|mgnify:CR=1 FL=1|jgi:esterase/lipase superfamily enzyme
MLYRTLIFVVAFGLASCADRGAVRIMPEARGVGQVETIFIGTNRSRDDATGELFGFGRQAETRFAKLEISIPPDRKAGEIVWPRKNRIPDPTKQFVALDEVIYPGDSQFRSDLHAKLVSQPSGAREAVIFVHGFNNNFAEGAYRIAQLGNDLGIKGALVHYSWPSRANPLGYVYDRDSALFARDGLEDLLREVEAAGARDIVIVAHSMGSAIVMETLRQLALEKDHKIRDRIKGVVLMSPDIDIDVFHAQAVRIGKLPQPFLIFTSKRDKALALSARLTGQRDRVGNLATPDAVADLDVTLIDTTAFSVGAGHFNVGNSAVLLSILGKIGDVDAAISADSTSRTGLLGGVVLTVQNATQVILSPVTALANGG